MTMTYYFPKIDRSTGYSWNMLQRIHNTIDLEPTASGDVGDQTYVEFSRELTQEEEALVAAVMDDNPTQAPATTGTRFIVRDLWNQKAAVEAALGFTYEIYYTESVPGSGDVDQIELHFPTLTEEQEAQVIAEYGNLINKVT